MEAKKVCIVGAGVAGLTTLKYLLTGANVGAALDIKVYDANPDVGGLWYYAYGDNKPGGPGVLYKGLRTNNPKHCITFTDLPHDEDAPEWLSGNEIKCYLKRYADKHALQQYIQFEMSVKQIQKIDGGDGDCQWKVTVASNNEERKDVVFDCVIVCSGMQTIPYSPDIAGLRKFRGRKIHSSQYRTSDDFQHKRILLVGGRASLWDILSHILDVSEKVIVSTRGPNYLPDEGKWILKSDIQEFTGNTVIFNDGEEIEVDDVILCTGYEGFRNIPFLHESCQVQHNDMYMTPIYKSMFHAHHPTLMFNGFWDFHAALPLFECMAIFIAKVVHGHITLPNKTEMLEATANTFQEYRNSGAPLNWYYCIGLRQIDYVTDLCKQGGYNYPKISFHIFNYIIKKIVQDKAYLAYRQEKFEIINDEHFNIHQE